MKHARLAVLGQVEVVFVSIMEPDRFQDPWLGVEIRHLAALEAVAKEGSFGRAAAALGYTQSAVSQQIQMLERIVGERLLERPGGPRAVSLTEAGTLLLRHAEAIVGRLRAAQADMTALADGDAGSLRIGTFQSVGAKVLPEVMRRFLDGWPQIELELTESASDDELLRLVERGELTLIANRACRSTALAEGELVQRGVAVDVAFRSDDNGTVQGLVGASFGAALVPLLTVDQRDGRIRVLELEPEIPSRRIALAWHRDRHRSPASRAFAELAREVCAEVESSLALVPTG